MKLEKNMYVRTKDGAIAKIEQIVDDEIHFNIKPIFSNGEEFGYNWLYIKDIIKASHNIIDLIEVGDYVNGCEVVLKDFNNLNEECLECGIGDYIVCSYEAKDIKSIVTKEQFDAMAYRIGE